MSAEVVEKVREMVHHPRTQFIEIKGATTSFVRVNPEVWQDMVDALKRLDETEM